MSDSPKYFPGPWYAVRVPMRIDGPQPLFQDGLWHIKQEEIELIPVAILDHGDDHCPETRKKAEHAAHLIAAAPELFEALKALFKGWTDGDVDNGDGFALLEVSAKDWKAAFAALAKAEGGTR